MQLPLDQGAHDSDHRTIRALPEKAGIGKRRTDICSRAHRVWVSALGRRTLRDWGIHQPKSLRRAATLESLPCVHDVSLGSWALGARRGAVAVKARHSQHTHVSQRHRPLFKALFCAGGSRHLPYTCLRLRVRMIQILVPYHPRCCENREITSSQTCTCTSTSCFPSAHWGTKATFAMMFRAPCIAMSTAGVVPPLHFDQLYHGLQANH